MTQKLYLYGLTVYTQEVGRAGRDGSKAEAILCYNGTNLAQRHVDRSVKEYCKERKSCRRELSHPTLILRCQFQTRIAAMFVILRIPVHKS